MDSGMTFAWEFILVAFSAAITSTQTSDRDPKIRFLERLQMETLSPLLDDPTARRMLVPQSLEFWRTTAVCVNALVRICAVAISDGRSYRDS